MTRGARPDPPTGDREKLWTVPLALSADLSACRVVVTGGSGFIGSHLIEALMSVGASVTNLDIKPPTFEHHHALWRSCDIRDSRAVADAFAASPPEIIYNLAAVADIFAPADRMAVNTVGLENVLEQARQSDCAPLVVHFSTQLVVAAGYTATGPLDFRPYTTYGETKAQSERLLHAHGQALEWTIIRPTNVWGPWHPTFGDQIWRYLEKGYYLHPDGKDPYRSYGYVTNVVWQVIRLAELPRDQVVGKTLYVGDEALPSSVWLDAFSRALRGTRTRRVPGLLLKLIAEAGELSARLGGPSPINRGRLDRMTKDYIVPMQPTLDLLGRGPVTLQDGVDTTVEWLRSRKPTHLTRSRRLVMVGPLPPPLGGAAKITAAMQAMVQGAGVAVRGLDTSTSALSHNRTAGHHLLKAVKSVRTAAVILASRHVGSVYLVPDGGLGIWYSLIFAMFARRYRKVFLHHHTCRYVQRDDAAMRWITRLLGDRATHVLLTPQMARQFDERYGPVHTVVLGNACFTSAAPLPPDDDVPRSVRLGHLSNLCREKGVYTVADTFDRLRTGGLDVELHLAGPCMSTEVERRVEQLCRDHGDRVTYHGAIYDDAKTTFYRRLDRFLFPTEFEQEAAPNVLFEAAAAGVPTLSVSRACIPEILEELGGSCCPPDADFTDFVMLELGRTPRPLTDAQRVMIRDRFDAAYDRSARESSLLVDALASSVRVPDVTDGA